MRTTFMSNCLDAIDIFQPGDVPMDLRAKVFRQTNCSLT